jgi:hypothetical protein
MRHLKFIIAVVVGSGVAMISWLQHSRNENLQRDNEMLRATIASLRDLNGSSRPISTGESLTRDQLAELLKLRSEVTRLREQTNQIGALVEANQNLAASIRELKASEPKKERHPEDARPQDIHPRDSWAFRGYATPEAAMESLLWATANGDKEMLLEAYSPEARPKQQAAMANTERKMNDPRFAADEAEFIAKQKSLTEFRIVNRRQVSDDEMVLTIYLATPGADGDTVMDTGKAVFKRIGGEWKVTDKGPSDD